MIDVLYRVRAGRNDSLRYSLRSLANVPHGDVHMVGFPPKWVRNVEVITPKQWRTKWRALVGDLLLACEQLSGRRLLLIDDDMYVLTRRERVETLHAGDLRTSAERKAGTYGRTMNWTADYLEGMGITGLLSYELHIPLEIDADGMAEAIAPVVNAKRPLQARSLYGNLTRIGGTEAADVKLHDGSLPAEYLSSDPRSWLHWLPMLTALFPTASDYE